MRIRSLLLSSVVPLSLLLSAPAQVPVASSTAEQSVGSTAPVSEPERLMKLALEALQKRDVATAQSLLDRIKAIDPAYKDLAGNYGGLDYDRGDFAAAVRDYQSELAQHPDSVWVYAPMATAQARSNHRDEAIATLRAWVDATPGKPDAATALAGALLDGNDAAGAVAAATAGLAALPADKHSDDALQLLLGRAQLASGATEAGVATLSTQLKSSDQPLTLNNAAYELAKAGKSLPLAEAAERRAINRLAAASRAWTLDEGPEILRARSTLLFATWDTLGYILYSEGNYVEALDFIRAAWTNMAHEEIGEHLGDTYDKLARHQESLVSYLLALSTTPASGPEAKRLRDKIEAQKKLGAKADKIDAAAALVRLRTISLGAAGSHQGEAEYVLLVSRDRVEKARPTGEKAVAGGVELMLKGDVSRYTPISFDVRLAKVGMLKCHATCELVFEP